MISTNFDMFQAHQNQPSVRQGKRKRRRRKHYDAPAKQDTSKRPPLDRKSQWHGNENTQPSKTLRLRSETTRRASRSYDSCTGPMKTALADPSKTRFHDESTWHTLIASPRTERLRTVANGCERLRTLEQLLANTASTRPPLINENPSLRIRKKTRPVSWRPGEPPKCRGPPWRLPSPFASASSSPRASRPPGAASVAPRGSAPPRASQAPSERGDGANPMGWKPALDPGF